MVIWNYRGYGQSTGKPDPSVNRQDVEVVFQWAREKTEKEVRGRTDVKIGVHGISIGGLAATHLGRIGAVDFMMIDRSFSELISIPRQWSKYLPPIMKFITMWDNPDSSRDFLYSNCYKVVAQDPKDEVIHDICSLKTGISLNIIQNELENK